MIYRQLFERVEPGKTVRAGIIGSGQYATSLITQSPAIPRLEVLAVADVEVEAARRALRQAGLAEEACVFCESRAAALGAIERGRRAIVADASLLMELPLDVIVESTGVPEAGARHAAAAIAHGKHVAMVSKETDVVVGPVLKHRADRAGVVYTAVDGDQHGLLMGLVAWARELGLEVLCGGKAIGHELLFDADAGTVSRGAHAVPLAKEDVESFRPLPPGPAPAWLARRRSALGSLGALGGYDLVEMAIAANATGLLPDMEELHGPVLRIPEIPEALCPLPEGGILQRRGAIEAITCLRGPGEAGLGGGVFIVVGCENDASRAVMISKGLIANRRGTAALVYRPYHLCGVETALSLLCAVLLGVPTGATEYAPRVDVLARAREPLKAGDRAGGDHDRRLQALIYPARAVTDDAPLPLHMANGNRIRTGVPAGTILTATSVEAPADSALWSLRAEQDRIFGLR